MIRTFALVGLCLLASTLSAFAQDASRLDLAGGYALVQDRRIDESLHGWSASATFYLTRWLGVAAEVDGTYASQPVLGTDLDLANNGLVVGPRVAVRRSTRLAPFGHVLVGAVRASAGILDQSDATTDLGVQMGGGVDLSLASRARLRLGGDYRRVLGDFEGDQLRATASLVVPFGSFP
jgi:hypothetical protein